MTLVPVAGHDGGAWFLGVVLDTGRGWGLLSGWGFDEVAPVRPWIQVDWCAEAVTVALLGFTVGVVFGDGE